MYLYGMTNMGVVPMFTCLLCLLFFKPVLDLQVAYVVKVPFVGGHEGHVAIESGGGNKKVFRGYVETSEGKGCCDVACNYCCIMSSRKGTDLFFLSGCLVGILLQFFQHFYMQVLRRNNAQLNHIKRSPIWVCRLGNSCKIWCVSHFKLWFFLKHSILNKSDHLLYLHPLHKIRPPHE